MIIDYLYNIENYREIIPYFDDVICLLAEVKDMQPGRYERNKIFVLVQEGITKPLQEDLFETHQTYIDLQLMLEGEEYMEWEDSSNLELEIPYEEEHDICFWKGSGKNIKITNQMFYLVFPHDAHKPCRYQEEPNKYRKLVFKLLRD